MSPRTIAAPCDHPPMAEWIYFIHPPRENFAATMTEEESAVWSVHFGRFERMLVDGSLILVGIHGKERRAVRHL